MMDLESAVICFFSALLIVNVLLVFWADFTGR